MTEDKTKEDKAMDVILRMLEESAQAANDLCERVKEIAGR